MGFLGFAGLCGLYDLLLDTLWICFIFVYLCISALYLVLIFGCRFICVMGFVCGYWYLGACCCGFWGLDEIQLVFLLVFTVVICGLGVGAYNEWCCYGLYFVVLYYLYSYIWCLCDYILTIVWGGPSMVVVVVFVL